MLDDCALGMLCGQDPGSQHNLDTLSMFSSMIYISLVPRVIHLLGPLTDADDARSVLLDAFSGGHRRLMPMTLELRASFPLGDGPTALVDHALESSGG